VKLVLGNILTKGQYSCGTDLVCSHVYLMETCPLLTTVHEVSHYF